MKEPNFMIAGAARSGTTSLYHYLAQHPDIYMSKPVVPESKHFVYPEEFNKGKEYLLSTRYKDVKNEKAIGEKTTHYMNCEGVPGRIFSYFPNMMFIFLLRDPVERAISNYWWSVKNGLEKLPIEEAMYREEERVAGYEGKWKVIQPFSYIQRGYYMRYIREYLKFYSRENMLFLIMEDMENHLQEVMSSVSKFLGIKEQSLERFQKINEADRVEGATPELIRYLVSVFHYSNEELEQFLNKSLVLWRREHSFLSL